MGHSPVFKRRRLNRTPMKKDKFNGPEWKDGRLVAGKIKNTVEQVRAKRSLLDEADDWIRERHYTADRLEIVRLSDERLPMDQCYINLAIIEKPSSNASQAEKGMGEGGDTQSRPSKFSLAARLKTEAPNKDAAVELPALFLASRGPKSSTKEPRRILIRGRAGVGKTTLCKKMVYDFLYDRMWNEHFDRILWVPLRRLKAWGNGPLDFEQLFYHEFFRKCLDPARKCAFAKETCRALDESRTLLVLDGLDEVSGEWSRGEPEHDFLLELLNQPNVIVTSRPYGKDLGGLDRFDLELEAIGFSPDQMKVYVQKAFTDSRMAGEVVSFLQRFPLLHSLARIPIQLDALCYIWSEAAHSNQPPETMTTIYQDIEQSLWKKDILRLRKLDNGKPVTEGDIEHATRRRIEKFVRDEVAFLESLAFAGLDSDMVEFKPKHWTAVSDNFPDLLPDKTLPSLSFLRTSDPLADYGIRSYHFLHLTYQEYFAARYFVRQWTAGETLEYAQLDGLDEDAERVSMEPETFLQRRKYDARYDIFWRFVAGLHSSKQAFFFAIEQEPRDLLGPTHQRLVMHCLSEVGSSAKFPIRPSLEAKLAQWILFECELTETSQLAQEPECLDSVLCAALECRPGPPTGLLYALQDHQAHLSTTTVAALGALLKHGDLLVRGMIARILGRVLERQSELSPGAVTSLVSLLCDRVASVRRSAVFALERHSKVLPMEIVSRIIVLLSSNETYESEVAARVLERQLGLLPKETVAGVVALLKDDSSFATPSAANALESESKLLPVEAATSFLALFSGAGGSVRSDVADMARRILAREPQPSSDVARSLVVLADKTIELQAVDDPRYQLAAATDLFNSLRDDDKNGDSFAQTKAANVLRCALERQSKLSIEGVTDLVALLKDDSSSVRRNAADVLQHQSLLTAEAIAGLGALLNDNDISVRSAAANALSGRSELPAEVLTGFISLLKDDDPHIQWKAATELGCQPELPTEAVTGLVALVKDRTEFVGQAAAIALSRQPKLPRGAVASLVMLLKDHDTRVPIAAANALAYQSELPVEVITDVVSLLKDADTATRYRIAYAVGRQSRLSKLALEAAGLTAYEGANDGQLICSVTLVELLCVIWLRRSFGEQASLYIDDSRRVCTVNLSHGLRTALFEDQSQHDQFLDAIDKGRQLLGQKWQHLWEDPRRDDGTPSWQYNANETSTRNLSQHQAEETEAVQGYMGYVDI